MSPSLLKSQAQRKAAPALLAHAGAVPSQQAFPWLQGCFMGQQFEKSPSNVSKKTPPEQSQKWQCLAQCEPLRARDGLASSGQLNTGPERSPCSHASRLPRTVLTRGSFCPRLLGTGLGGKGGLCVLAGQKGGSQRWPFYKKDVISCPGGEDARGEPRGHRWPGTLNLQHCSRTVFLCREIWRKREMGRGSPLGSLCF